MRTGWLSVMIACSAACGPAAREDSDGGDSSEGVDAPTGGDGDPGFPDGDQALATFVYAHTAEALYKVDPDTLAVTLVGSFSFSGFGESITDIAVDRTGRVIGISGSSVFRIDPDTAAATRLASDLTGQFNGLSFVPAAQIGQSGDDVLVATRNADGTVFRIDPATGAKTEIGSMGAYSSSGDLVSVAMLGTLQTADNGAGPDRLVRLAPTTFAATVIGTDIGFGDIWGIAFWKDKVFGFTSGGEFITIDPNTGVGTLVQSNGPAWWGAAVTTLAPVVL